MNTFPIPPNLPGPALQAVTGPGPATQRILDIFSRLTNWGTALLFVLAAAFIVYAAYLYLTSKGDAEKVKEANQVIIYSVVSVGVALLAYVFINIVRALVAP